MENTPQIPGRPSYLFITQIEDQHSDTTTAVFVTPSLNPGFITTHLTTPNTKK